MKRFASLLWAIVLISLGTIAALNAMEITHINIFFDGWWTLLIIVPCFIGLFQHEERLGDLIGIAIGIVCLLVAQRIISIVLVFRLIIPIILILIGIKIILKDVIVDSTMKKIKSVNKDDLEKYRSSFSTQRVEMDGVDFKGANLEAVFGLVSLDLNGSNLSEDRVINASARFGTIVIFVPDNVNIKVRSNSMFGGVNNKIKRKNIEEAHTIYINGSGVFGSVDIKPVAEKES